MDTSTATPWDVAIALRDVSMELGHHQRNGLTPDGEVLRHWHEWIVKAALAHNALAFACENLVELGATDERMAAMKIALTHAMGQDEYWARADRW